LAQDAGADAAVAAVRAAAADDGDAAREGPENRLGDRGSGALHQLVERPGVRLLGPPRLLCREQRDEPHPTSSATATAAASPREWVIESSIRSAPSRAAKAAVRPDRWTPGFGRPRISISFQVK